MKVRRYYPKGEPCKKTYSEEYLEVLSKAGVDVRAIDTAKTEIVLDRKEQEEMYSQCCTMVLENTRWVLDNLERLPEFKVNWQRYHKKTKSI